MTSELLTVVGARPNFVKVAPVLHALRGRDVRVRVLHTGQHYDRLLSDAFLEQLDFPPVEFALGAGSGSHAEQTAAVMVGTERVIEAERPAALLVAGDVNSTMAAALAAVKLGVRVIHLEAGLRSRDREMPEEINRIVTDRVSDLLLCPSDGAAENLAAEGVQPDRVHVVGNTMIDSLLRLLPVAERSDVLDRLSLEPGAYVLVTLHRPSLVDDPERLEAVLAVLRRLARRIPVVVPLHPRTRDRIESQGPEALGGLIAGRPLEYLDFVALESRARLVITDSGGVQEETSVLGVPCLTCRTTTERPITVSLGTNRVVGVDPSALETACQETLAAPPPASRPSIPLWDGHAGERAADVVAGALPAWEREGLTPGLSPLRRADRSPARPRPAA